VRFRHRDGSAVHLAYCTNVHPAESLDGVLAQLADYAEPIRRRLGWDRLGLGLWLARPVAARLAAAPGSLAVLRRQLDRRGLEVVTLNAFPYAGFHAPSVKKAVYRPGWTEPDRLHYTLDCARVLAALLPEGADRGSVSTLPLAWREPWSSARADRARRHLDSLAQRLAAVETRTGRAVRVGFEPEPGCLIENTTQAATLLSTVDRDRLGVCLDACHLAVGFEDPTAACARLHAAGLPIVKTQASCALQLDNPRDRLARAALERFDERRFLHQTRERHTDTVLGTDDLPEALAGALPGDGPWRVHFHVPLHTDPPPGLRATRPELLKTLGVLLGGDAALTDHIEVETYSWPVLPEAPGGAGLVEGVAAELAWTRDAITALGLKEVLS
jgi:sugar phosphate isomerase/epimerase